VITQLRAPPIQTASAASAAPGQTEARDAVPLFSWHPTNWAFYAPDCSTPPWRLSFLFVAKVHGRKRGNTRKPSMSCGCEGGEAPSLDDAFQ